MYGKLPGSVCTRLLAYNRIKPKIAIQPIGTVPPQLIALDAAHSRRVMFWSSDTTSLEGNGAQTVCWPIPKGKTLTRQHSSQAIKNDTRQKERRLSWSTEDASPICNLKTADLERRLSHIGKSPLTLLRNPCASITERTANKTKHSNSNYVTKRSIPGRRPVSRSKWSFPKRNTVWKLICTPKSDYDRQLIKVQVFDSI